MPCFIVKVIFTYPVTAVDAQGALSTVPEVIRMKWAGRSGEGVTEILDAVTKEVLLKAGLHLPLSDDRLSTLD